MSQFLPQRRRFAFFCFVGLGILAWIRLLFRDRWIGTEIFFHLPFLALPLACAIVGCAVRVSRPGAIVLMLAALPALAVPFWLEQPRLLTAARAHKSPSQSALKITCWNVMSFNRGQDAVVGEYRSEDADIVCLLEGTYRGRPPDFLQKGLGKQFHWASTRQLAIGSRLPILDSGEIPCETRLRLFRARIKTPNGPLTVVLVDVPGPPRLDTEPMFNELWATLQTIDGPFILIGDFNTPRHSWHLDRATSGLTDAYVTAAGRGWLGSWPCPVPAYQLDHCFLSEGLTTLDARLSATTASDHCRQSVRFGVDPVTRGEGSSPRHEVKRVP